MKVAIMQPYYFPYAGYFRLFAATDLFVFLDDVQWNRRGRVHRREVTKGIWDTLPIKKTDRDTTMIKDLRWQEGKEKGIAPVDFIIASCISVIRKLSIKSSVGRSSNHHTPDNLRSQDRIIAICKKLGASEYVNSPGGRHLYDEPAFAKEGIRLTFLPEWKGSYDSILERLAHERPENVRADIYDQI